MNARHRAYRSTLQQSATCPGYAETFQSLRRLHEAPVAIPGLCVKQAIREQGNVVMYRLVNDRLDSKVKTLGIQLAILDGKGKPQKSWHYEMSELRRAESGFQTLVDAQERGVLSDRAKWRIYD